MYILVNLKRYRTSSWLNAPIRASSHRITAQQRNAVVIHSQSLDLSFSTFLIFDSFFSSLSCFLLVVIAEAMWTRAVSQSRRPGGSSHLADSHLRRPREWPVLYVVLIALGGLALLALVYTYSSLGGFSSDKEGLSRSEGIPCTSEVQRAIPLLKKAYGDSMLKVLHVGPETCSIVAQLLKEEETETWGVEPYDLEDADSNCKTLVRKGIVRVADIKFPLPYRADSFNLVIVSDALDYLSPKYLNRTLLEICGVLGLL